MRDNYEDVARRLNAFVDFTKVKDINTYEEEVRRVSEKEPFFEHLFGKKRGEVKTGVEKIFDKNDSQRRMTFDDEDKNKPHVTMIKRDNIMLHISKDSRGFYHARAGNRFVALPREFKKIKE